MGIGPSLFIISEVSGLVLSLLVLFGVKMDIKLCVLIILFSSFGVFELLVNKSKSDQVKTLREVICVSLFNHSVLFA